MADAADSRRTTPGVAPETAPGVAAEVATVPLMAPDAALVPFTTPEETPDVEPEAVVGLRSDEAAEASMG